jgi:hypothetical protein
VLGDLDNGFAIRSHFQNRVVRPPLDHWPNLCSQLAHRSLTHPVRLSLGLFSSVFLSLGLAGVAKPQEGAKTVNPTAITFCAVSSTWDGLFWGCLVSIRTRSSTAQTAATARIFLTRRSDTLKRSAITDRSSSGFSA